MLTALETNPAHKRKMSRNVSNLPSLSHPISQWLGIRPGSVSLASLGHRKQQKLLQLTWWRCGLSNVGRYQQKTMLQMFGLPKTKKNEKTPGRKGLWIELGAHDKHKTLGPLLHLLHSGESIPRARDVDLAIHRRHGHVSLHGGMVALLMHVLKTLTHGPFEMKTKKLLKGFRNILPKITRICLISLYFIYHFMS